MKRTFVTISIGALIALSPLAAMAQSEGSPQPLKVPRPAQPTAGGGGSHSRHMRHRANTHKERARAGAGTYTPDAYGAAAPKTVDRNNGALQSRPRAEERVVLILRGRGYFDGQGLSPRSPAHILRSYGRSRFPEPAMLKMTVWVLFSTTAVEVTEPPVSMKVGGRWPSACDRHE